VPVEQNGDTHAFFDHLDNDVREPCEFGIVVTDIYDCPWPCRMTSTSMMTKSWCEGDRAFNRWGR
jgi:hypothetical protein